MSESNQYDNFMTPAPATGAQSTPITAAEVTLLDAQGHTVRTVALTTSGLTVGRLPSSDLVLEAPTVSRNHARIDWDGHQSYVTDLGARSGTLLGTLSLMPQQTHAWMPDQGLQIGPYSLKLHVRPTSSSATAASPIAPSKRAPVPMAGSIGATVTTVMPPNQISVALAPGQDYLELMPGQLATANIAVFNDGAADTILLSIDGLPPEWLAAPPPPLTLDAGESIVVPITINVPELPENLAGEHAVTVRAQSATYPAHVGLAHARWQVLPFTASQLELSPRRAQAQEQAVYTLRVHNLGNAPATYNLRAEDDEQALAFGFAQSDVEVAPGQLLDVPLTVQASRRFYGRPRRYNFLVHATNETTAQTAEGQFVHDTVLPFWALPALGSLLMLILLCGLLPPPAFGSALAGLPIGFLRSSPATTTAVANNGQVATNLAIQQLTQTAIQIAIAGASADSPPLTQTFVAGIVTTATANAQTSVAVVAQTANANATALAAHNGETPLAAAPTDTSSDQPTTAPADQPTDAPGQPTNTPAPGVTPSATSSANPTATTSTSATSTPVDSSSGPSLTTSDVSVKEGDSAGNSVNVVLTLSESSTSSVTVNYATVPDSANTPSDYTTDTGTVTFAPGDTTKTIAITVNGNTVVDSDRAFEVVLSDISGATLDDSQSRVTIVNDDQEISFAALTNRVFGDTSPVIATTSSGLPVIFASLNADNCAFQGNVFTIKAIGACAIVASQPGNSTFNAAKNVQRAFTITPKPITFSVGDPSETFDGTAAPQPALTFTGGASAPLPSNPADFLFSYVGTNGTSYSAKAAPPTNAGSYNVTVTLNNPNFSAAQGSRSFTITAKPVTFTVANPSKTYNDTPVTQPAITITGSSAPLPASPADFRFSYAGTGTTTYPANATAPKDAGTYLVTVTVNNPNFSGSRTQAFTITPKTVTFSVEDVSKTYNGTPVAPPTIAFAAGSVAPLPASPADFQFSYVGITPATAPSPTRPTNVGSYRVTVSLNNSASNSNYAASPVPRQFTISPAATTTTLTNLAAITFSTGGQTVTLNAHVTGAGGTVTFSAVGFPAIPAANVNGAGNATATLAVPAGKSADTYTISAVYSVTGNFTGSSGTTTLTIKPVVTTTTLTNPAAITFSTGGQTVALSAHVTGNPNGGTVTFSAVGFPAITAANVNGSGDAIATLIVPAGKTADAYTINAVYHDNAGNFADSPDTATLTIKPVITTTALTVTSAIITFSTGGQSVTLSAHVTGNPNGGAVTFSAVGFPGGTSAAVDGGGNASITLTVPANTPVNTYTINAVYHDNAGNFADSPDSATLTIKKAPTTITAANPMAIAFSAANQTVTLTAQVTGTGGTVTFSVVGIPGSVSGIVDGAGNVTATLTVPGGKVAGSYMITADYSGTTNFLGDSDTATLTINP